MAETHALAPDLAIAGSRRLATRTTAAVAGAVLVIVLFAAGAVLYALNGGAEAPDGTDFTLGVLIATMSFGLPGSLLVARSDVPLIGWVSLAAGISLGFAGVTEGWALYAVSTSPGSLPWGEAALWLSVWCWVPGYTLVITLLLLLLPDGRLASRGRRAVAIVSAVAITAATAANALARYSMSNLPRGFAGHSNPLAAPGAARVFGYITLLLIPCLLAAVGLLARRFRRASADEREQLTWVALGGAVTILLFAVSFAVGSSGDVLFAAGMVPLPLGVAIAVMRHGLWDIELVINRSLVYGTLSAIAILTYVAVVAVVSSAVGGIVAVGVIAVALQPIHRRVQATVNRLLYGERDDPAATLERLGDRLVAAGDLDEILPAAAETVGRALRLPYVAVELPDGGGGTHGRAVGEPVTFELRYRGEPVGELLVCPRDRGARLSAADERALEVVGRQLAVAAHSVHLARELQRSRERIVVAREEERRRLRRDLHDGLGPTLAALALELESARELLDTAPDRVDATLERAAAHARDTVGDVRRIVYELRPAALDDLGLAQALREQAQRLSAGGLSIAVHAPHDLPPLPAAVEAATYRIVSEALANTVRHADAHTCSVELSLDNGTLSIRVCDDGRGLPDLVRAGVGLTSMRERAEELGGRYEIKSGASGTEVSAALPIASS